MPTHLVTMHAALLSQAMRTSRQVDSASIRIWRSDPETSAVAHVEVEPCRCFKQEIAGWTLNLDQRLLTALAELRAAKLPNETGGVLIGHYNLKRRFIYVVDTIPSPPDSAEWPTLYIRGSEGLLPQVKEMATRTGGQLEYVGEWHSHPDACWRSEISIASWGWGFCVKDGGWCFEAEACAGSGVE